MIFLALPELLRIAARTLGPDYDVRDYGLLEAAPARPQATASGKDAYPTLDTKGAALLHSLARNHVLIGGNERLAPAALIASRRIDEVDDIAAVLDGATEPRD